LMKKKSTANKWELSRAASLDWPRKLGCLLSATIQAYP
jgi:hypothetical protein